MNISAPFIQRPIMTTLVMIALLMIGILSYIKLPVSDLPNVDYPTIEVKVPFPGASPETMANTVAAPLEKQFMTIQGVTRVTSNSTLGNTQITLQFDVSKSLDSAALDVQTAIAKAQGQLPQNLPNPPTFSKVNPSDTPILYIAVTSDTMSLQDIYTYAYTFIGQRLSTVEGVAQVLTYGSPYAVRIQVDPEQISSQGLTLIDVADAVVRSNPNLPTGQLDGKNTTYILNAVGQLNNASEFDPIIVRYQNGNPVRISDIGQAKDSLENVRFTLTYNDGINSQRGVVLAIQRQPGANTIEVARRVGERLPQLIEQLPKSLNLNIVYNKAFYIEESVFDVKLTLILALILVVLVIFLYLGKAADTIIPSLAMPMSIVITFWFMDILNFTIDNLSLLALTLATGFIVDDAIVVLENIVRRVESGEDRWTAALRGSKQISFTILSMTLSLAAVFIPLVFMYGLIGKIFFEFSMTMIIVILASGFVSLTLTPMLASIFVAGREGGLTRVEEFSNRMNAFLQKKYKSSLEWVLERRISTLIVGALSVVLSLYFFVFLPKDFLPGDDIGFMIAFTQANEGTSPDEMKTLQDELAKIIRQNPYVKSFVSLSGYPQTRQGIAFIVLKPYSERPKIADIVHDLYSKAWKVVGLNTFVKIVPLIDITIGSQVRGSFQYSMQSIQSDLLYKSAEEFIEKMKTLPGFVGVNSDLEIHTPELKVEVIRDQASSYGVNMQDVETTLQLAYGGGKVTEIETPFDQYDVIVEVLDSFKEKPVDLEALYVRSNTTQELVPLRALANWQETTGPSSVNHISQFPAVTTAFSLAPGVPLGDAIDQLKKLAQETLPAEVIGQVEGAASTFEQSIQSSAYLFILAIFAIYIVLGILYESFIHPLTILSSLPPAIVGGLFTLWLFGYPLSLYSYLGLLLLIGIVKKNGILVVDYALENVRSKHETIEQSIIEACVVRFRPIMMTTIAAIMGALPIALGFGPSAEARRPLGLVIVGGLLISQLITLYLTPVVYLYLEVLNEKFTIKGGGPNGDGNSTGSSGGVVGSSD